MTYTVTENCILCGTCWEICPNDAIVEHEWYYRIDDSCMDCGMCIRVCPNTAIRKNRTTNRAEAKGAKQT